MEGAIVDVTPSPTKTVFETTTVLTTSAVLLDELAAGVPEPFKDARKSLRTSLFVDDEDDDDDVPRRSLELDGVLVVTVLLRTWRFTCRGK